MLYWWSLNVTFPAMAFKNRASVVGQYTKSERNNYNPLSNKETCTLNRHRLICSPTRVTGFGIPLFVIHVHSIIWLHLEGVHATFIHVHSIIWLHLEGVHATFIHVHSIIWLHLEGVHATFSSASHYAYKALFCARTFGRLAICFAVAFHRLKQSCT